MKIKCKLIRERIREREKVWDKYAERNSHNERKIEKVTFAVFLKRTEFLTAENFKNILKGLVGPSKVNSRLDIRFDSFYNYRLSSLSKASFRTVI